MIEYSQSEWINYYIPGQSAAYLAVIFCKNYSESVVEIEHFLHRFINISPSNIKETKERCDKAWRDIMVSSHCIYHELNKILEIEGKQQQSLNLIHSLTRIPEWFMYTEKYLSEEYAPNMKNHLEDINALAVKESEYPYDKETGLGANLNEDLDNQEQHIIKYIKKNLPNDPIMNKRVNKESIKGAIKKIKGWIYSRIDDVPEYARPWIQMIKDIRKDVSKVVEELDEVLKNGFNAKQLTLSESICYLNDESWAKHITSNILQWQGKDGKGKISAIIGNIFHMYYKGVPIPKTDGQLDLYNETMDMLFSKAAPGLGPAFKIRIVFSTSSEIQNLTEILASFLKKYHKNCYHHAYLDQTGYILANAKYFKDVQCTDCTGYSDYLNRNIYREILEMMGFPLRHIQWIMNILGMPVKVVDEIFPVPFGSLQGVKFLVYIMNDANALIGLIQNDLRVTKWDTRQNAGDDVYAASTTEEFTATDLNIDMAVWLWFNCPTNLSKSAWLKRDGYWDFCKVFFGKDGMPLTGLPPKLYNKEILNIRDVSELYKNFDRTGVEPLRPIEDFCHILKDNLEYHWREGMRLYNPISDLSLEDKIEVAKEISYSMGGLSSLFVTDEFKINHLIQYCYDLYTKYDIQIGDIYTWAIQCGFTGVISEFLLQVRSLKVDEFMEYLEMLEFVLECYKNGIVCQDDIDQIEADFERMTRVYLDSGKTSASGSTYHRITPIRSGDTTLVKHLNYIEEGIDVPYKVPACVFDNVAYAKVFSNVMTANMARMNEYALVTNLYHDYLHEGNIEMGGGGNYHNCGVRAYIKDEQGRRFRLYNVFEDTQRGDIYPEHYCSDIKMKSFIQLCKKYNLFEGVASFHSAATESVKRLAQNMFEDIKKELQEDYKHFYGPNLEKLQERSVAVTEEVLGRYKAMLKR